MDGADTRRAIFTVAGAGALLVACRKRVVDVQFTFGILAVVLGVMSCESHINSNYDALKRRATEEMSCPARELQIIELNANRRRVLCADRSATYIWDGYLWIREGADASGLCHIEDPDCANVKPRVLY